MILLMQALLLTDLTASIHNTLSSGFFGGFFVAKFSFESIVALSYLHIMVMELHIQYYSLDFCVRKYFVSFLPVPSFLLHSPNYHQKNLPYNCNWRSRCAKNWSKTAVLPSCNLCINRNTLGLISIHSFSIERNFKIILGMVHNHFLDILWKQT